ncbi:MAG: ATP-grasp domain-containing protein [Marinobacter sp.]|uniref:ATP-grasp domain-containing protein n=1 Tax=Marinobacter sp. TaxID=50741 RepID=UPI003F94681E
MNREGSRRLAAEELGVRTSLYQFVETKERFVNVIKAIGLLVVVKPVMSSSGKGQSTVTEESQIDAARDVAQSGGCAVKERVVVEGFATLFSYKQIV